MKVDAYEAKYFPDRVRQYNTSVSDLKNTSINLAPNGGAVIIIRTK